MSIPPSSPERQVTSEQIITSLNLLSCICYALRLSIASRDTLYALIAVAKNQEPDSNGFIEAKSFAVGKALAGPSAEDKRYETLQQSGLRAMKALEAELQSLGYLFVNFAWGHWNAGMKIPTRVRIGFLDFACQVHRAAQANPIYRNRPDVAIETAALRLLPKFSDREVAETPSTRKATRVKTREKQRTDTVERVIARASDRLEKLGVNPTDVFREKSTPLKSTDKVADIVGVKYNLYSTPPQTGTKRLRIMLDEQEIASCDILPTDAPRAINRLIKNLQSDVNRSVRANRLEPQQEKPQVSDERCMQQYIYYSCIQNSDLNVSKSNIIGFTSKNNISFVAANKSVIPNSMVYPEPQGTVIVADNSTSVGNAYYDNDNGLSVREMSQMLAAQAETVCKLLLPKGKKQKNKWIVGSLEGEPGQSLRVNLTGPKAGKWKDYATGQYGDLVDLWCGTRDQADTPAYRDIERFLTGKPAIIGFTSNVPARRQESTPRPTVTPLLEHGKPNLRILRPGIRYPKAVRQYLNARCIPDETISVYRVGELKLDSSVMVFPYYAAESDEIINVKYLECAEPGRKKKRAWFEPGCALGLWGWHTIQDWAGSVVICEGEVDAMSWHSMGCAALSVPNSGAAAYTVEAARFHFRNFKAIYISMDMDDAGKQAVERILAIPDFAGKFPLGIVKLPYKDINDCLRAGMNQEDILDCLPDMCI